MSKDERTVSMHIPKSEGDRGVPKSEGERRVIKSEDKRIKYPKLEGVHGAPK